MPAAEYGSLPFDEQIEFFRGKLNLPTASWTDIWEGEHARAFVVAGAMKDELLTDFRTAVDKVIAGGGTLEQFRKDFDDIVATHGWSYNGGRGWRTRVIYDTNLRTSYQAGRYKQMQEVADERPFWKYVHSDAVENPRPEHLAWDGLVLRHDDPWWDTHFPPNGWGCQCTVDTLTPAEAKEAGVDEAPDLELETKRVGVRGPSPRTVEVPKGIDPGFGYNVGKAAWGQRLSDDVMNQWRLTGADAWETLGGANWDTLGFLPAALPPTKAAAALGARVAASDLADRISDVIGGAERTYRVPGGLSWNVNAATLAKHLDPSRSNYLPLLPELLGSPQEVWLAFERHKGTGRVELRARAIRVFQFDKDRAVIAVAQGVRGQLEAWTFIPTSELRYINKQRAGQLLYRKG